VNRSNLPMSEAAVKPMAEESSPARDVSRRVYIVLLFVHVGTVDLYGLLPYLWDRLA
jgi:hypothetical protein